MTTVKTAMHRGRNLVAVHTNNPKKKIECDSDTNKPARNGGDHAAQNITSFNHRPILLNQHG